MGVFVDGQDDDTNLWSAPWVGLPIMGMRPPLVMPTEMSSFSNDGFDGSDALGLFHLKRFLGRHSVPFDIVSAQGALHFSVRGHFITEVSDTLGERPVPPWKRVRRAKMRLWPDQRPAGMVALPDGLLGIALSPDGGLRRMASVPRGKWQEMVAPALGELVAHPVGDGSLVLLGRDREGRPHLATLADPRLDVARWRCLNMVARAPPVTAVGLDGVVHLLPHRPARRPVARSLGRRHGRARPGRRADRIQRTGRMCRSQGAAGRRLCRCGRHAARGQDRAKPADRAWRGSGPESSRFPLAIVEDEKELLVVAMNAENGVAVRRVRGSAEKWQALGSLDELLEGPIAPFEHGAAAA